MGKRARRQGVRPPAKLGAPRLAVAYLYPAIPGMVSGAFTMSLLQMMVYEHHRNGIPPNIMANECGSGRLVDGRNELTKAFLDDTPCDWLLWVDSDMGFTYDAAERLLASADPKERPVVGGLCFGMRRAGRDDAIHSLDFVTFPTIYQFEERENEVGFRIVTDYPRGQLVLTAATGCAFLLIHRTALEKVRARDGDRWFDEIVHPKGPAGPTKFSEDMSFCIRLAAADVPLYVDTSVKTSHDKGGFFCTEAKWDEQQARTQAQEVSVGSD